MKKYKILYDSELIIHKHVLHRLEDYLNMLNNQSFNKERDILLLAKKY